MTLRPETGPISQITRIRLMQSTTHFTGTALVTELTTRDQMTPEGARSWIELKTGYNFDAKAMYKLRWPTLESAEAWSSCANLKVHIMSDSELVKLETDYRKLNNRPPRKPWEPWMYESAMGRADSAIRAR